MHYLPAPLDRRDEKLFRKVYRDDAWRAQGGKCCYCGEKIKLAEATADHVKPKKGGNYTSKANIKAACHPCNNAKGAMSVEDFKKALANPQGHSIPIMLASFRYRLWKRFDKFERRLEKFVGVKFT